MIHTDRGNTMKAVSWPGSDRRRNKTYSHLALQFSIIRNTRIERLSFRTHTLFCYDQSIRLVLTIPPTATRKNPPLSETEKSKVMTVDANT